MANRWGNNGNSDRLYVGGSKITADGDCSHEIKRHLLLERKAMTKLDSILKSRDITWLTKVHLIKAMVFPVVIYGCESWTIKKAEHRRIDAFELWCWRRPLRVPKGNQSWLFTGRTDAKAEAPILWPPDKNNWLIGKTLILGKIEGRRIRWLDGITDSMDWVWASSGSWQWTGKPGVLQPMGSQSWTWLSDWTELNWHITLLVSGVVVVQSLSHVRLFATPWMAACQASLFFTISRSLLNLMSIESVIVI